MAPEHRILLRATSPPHEVALCIRMLQGAQLQDGYLLQVGSALPHQAPQLKIVAIDMYSVNCGPWCLTVLLVFCNTSGGWSN